MCFLTSDAKKSSETTMGMVKRTRVVVRAWFKFNLEIISWLLFAPTPDFGQRLAGAVGEPFIPRDGGEDEAGSFQWVASKETTQPLFRCYQVGKWVKKTVLENVFLFLGFSSWLNCGCVLGQRHMTGQKSSWILHHFQGHNQFSQKMMKTSEYNQTHLLWGKCFNIPHQ